MPEYTDGEVLALWQAFNASTYLGQFHRPSPESVRRFRTWLGRQPDRPGMGEDEHALLALYREQEAAEQPNLRRFAANLGRWDRALRALALLPEVLDVLNDVRNYLPPRQGAGAFARVRVLGERITAVLTPTAAEQEAAERPALALPTHDAVIAAELARDPSFADTLAEAHAEVRAAQSEQRAQEG